MITTVTTRSADCPVSLDEAKAHLRVLNEDYDVLVQSLIEAATEYCETHTGRSLRVSQTLTQKYRQWPCNPVRFDRQPVLENVPESEPAEAATVVQYYDANGDLQEVDAENYRLHQSSEAAAYLEFDSGFTRPTLESRDDAVVITYLAGYGDVASVPHRAKQAILLLMGHWFWQGNAEDQGKPNSDVPPAVTALLGSLDPGVYR